ncbi:MAG: dipeptide/oligopeptide/nickel ABC transporter ATP-binding protein [Propionibacteriaceae bacterium]|nr:dipeptide/oligopeptide/nickel ABC transporter ATP-binding protein [Propionibacteriaceae bacterium]
MTRVLSLEGVTRTFRRGGHPVTAVDHADLELHANQTLALVGESGCGKSTLGKICVGLLQPDSGRIVDERGVVLDRARAWRALRPRFQLVFQDPYASFSPRLTLKASLLPLARRVHGAGALDQVVELLRQVGLEAAHLDRRPAQLSGGQLQRAALARALLAQPRLLVADEVVSALDVAMQDEIARLLRRLQRTWHFSLLFITHDLGLAREAADEVCVMADGRVVERGPAGQVIDAPATPAAQRLVEAIPRFPWRQ